MLSTTREYRGSGLGKVMVEKLTQVARDFDFPVSMIKTILILQNIL